MKPLSAAPTFKSISAAPVTASDVVCLWGDCHLPTSVCAAGLTCKYSDPYYSQCIEDPSFSVAAANGACPPTRGAAAATGPSSCCNPGAECNADHVCVIPEKNCKATATNKLPSSVPVQRPVAPPTAAGKTAICLYGDCTDPATACIPGTICQYQNPYYSQCVEDPTYDSYSAATCHGKYDWGCGGGQG
eukprot:CAMPEP_0170129264 /NCGR_PEP_ID=MMETSP0020_2-20130122/21733_1 /TAXON_ID=98059 /ORGANISM="Dinobryon sp., Strain UTEXLB2267" /LENGTH=188 /DNA_ID=CAMNT_0010363483 /DNA_START=36 /DNA_END=600 /DNA_ORIENTATION=-